MRAALFDMDRTLVRRETAGLWIRYQRDRGEATLRDQLRVAWWVAEYTAGVIDAPRVAEKALAQFRGMREDLLAARCDEWFRAYVLPHVCDAGRRAVRRHHEAGEVTAIVTGASRYAASPLARELGIAHVVATELDVEAGRFTGRPDPPLCYSHGKIERAERLARAQGFRLADATFYSDSFTDLPLLERVRDPVCVNPDRRLAAIARRRGWRVEAW